MVADPLRRIPLTAWVAGAMTAVSLLDPGISRSSYLLLAPWMHGGLDHLARNLAVFLPAGFWTERRVGRVPYAGFVVSAAYIPLYAPVALEYGGLSTGASGLTKALVAYVGLVTLVSLVGKLGATRRERRAVLGLVAHAGVLLLVSLYVCLTVARFLHLVPRPEGVAVGAHFTGLVLGWAWFAYRRVGV